MNWKVSSTKEHITATSPNGFKVVMSRKSKDKRVDKNCQRLLDMVGARSVWKAMAALR